MDTFFCFDAAVFVSAAQCLSHRAMMEEHLKIIEKL